MMLNNAWKSLHTYFAELDNISKNFSSDEFNALLIPIITPTDSPETVPMTEETMAENAHSDIGSYFDEIQIMLDNNLTLCRENLGQHIHPKDLNEVMSALIFHCDEFTLTKTLNDAFSKLDCHCETKLLSPVFVVKTQWPLLQRTHLQCRDGGEQFFNNVDNMLVTPSEYILSLEVYYFCLKQGFLGRYVNAPHIIEKYLVALSDVISTSKSAYVSPLSSELIQTDEREPTLGEDNAISP